MKLQKSVSLALRSMLVKCIDDSDNYGTGAGLLTEGNLYIATRTCGGYYNVLCDDGKWYSKTKDRFVVVINKG